MDPDPACLASGHGPHRFDRRETAMTDALWFEDLKIGMTFRSGEVEVDPARVKSFAAEFDPQPFHLDEAAARGSRFGGLVASGWHTAAITMKLLVTSELAIAGGLIGVSVDELQWPVPVRPGDVLHVESQVLELRPSRSGAPRGIVVMRTTTLKQDGTVVQQMTAKLLVPRRPVPDQHAAIPSSA
jgi:acyl dehydratase